MKNERKRAVGCHLLGRPGDVRDQEGKFAPPFAGGEKFSIASSPMGIF